MLDFLSLAAGAIWFLIPPGLANIGADISAKLFLRATFPLDLGKRWNGARIFGSHKTVRGLVVGVLFGVAGYALQRIVGSLVAQNQISYLSLNHIN